MTAKIASAFVSGAVAFTAFAPSAFANGYNNWNNGYGSQTDVSVNQNQQTTVDQQNNTNIQNNVVSTASTGGNSISDSSGNAQIDTGNATSNVNITNRAGMNVATLPQGGNSGFQVDVSGNGRNSNNDVTLQLTNHANLQQTNNTAITNNVQSTANSGNNTVNGSGSDYHYQNGYGWFGNWNANQGNTNIQTGDATSNVSISNEAGANFATVPSGGASNFNVDIQGNGRGSQNDVSVSSNNNTNLDQMNNTQFDNNVHSYANSGMNSAEDKGLNNWYGQGGWNNNQGSNDWGNSWNNNNWNNNTWSQNWNNDNNMNWNNYSRNNHQYNNRYNDNDQDNYSNYYPMMYRSMSHNDHDRDNGYNTYSRYDNNRNFGYNFPRFVVVYPSNNCNCNNYSDYSHQNNYSNDYNNEYRPVKYYSDNNNNYGYSNSNPCNFGYQNNYSTSGYHTFYPLFRKISYERNNGQNRKYNTNHHDYSNSNCNRQYGYNWGGNNWWNNYGHNNNGGQVSIHTGSAQSNVSIGNMGGANFVL